MGFQYAIEGILDFFKKKETKEDTSYMAIWKLAWMPGKISNETIETILDADLPCKLHDGANGFIAYYKDVFVQMTRLLRTTAKPVIMKFSSITQADMDEYENGVYDKYEEKYGKNAVGDEDEFIKMLNATKVAKLEKESSKAYKTIHDHSLYKSMHQFDHRKDNLVGGTFRSVGFDKASIIKLIKLVYRVNDDVNNGKYYPSDILVADDRSDYGINKAIQHLQDLSFEHDDILSFYWLVGICRDFGYTAESMLTTARRLGSKIVHVVTKTQPELFES